MTARQKIRLSILQQAATCTSALVWEDRAHDDIACDLVNEECVRGKIDGGMAIIYGITDKGLQELERATPLGKAKHLLKKPLVWLCSLVSAAIVYVLQLDSVKARLSALIDGLLK